MIFWLPNVFQPNCTEYQNRWRIVSCAHAHRGTHTHRHTRQTHTHKRTHTHKCRHTRTHTHTHKNEHTRTHTQAHTRTHAHTHKRTHTRTHAHKHTGKYTYTRKHTHTNEHTRTRTQTHTRTHTHSRTHAFTRSAPPHRWAFGHRWGARTVLVQPENLQPRQGEPQLGLLLRQPLREPLLVSTMGAHWAFHTKAPHFDVTANLDTRPNGGLQKAERVSPVSSHSDHCVTLSSFCLREKTFEVKCERYLWALRGRHPSQQQLLPYGISASVPWGWGVLWCHPLWLHRHKEKWSSLYSQLELLTSTGERGGAVVMDQLEWTTWPCGLVSGVFLLKFEMWPQFDCEPFLCWEFVRICTVEFCWEML